MLAIRSGKQKSLMGHRPLYFTFNSILEIPTNLLTPLRVNMGQSMVVLLLLFVTGSLALTAKAFFPISVN